MYKLLLFSFILGTSPLFGAGTPSPSPNQEEETEQPYMLGSSASAAAANDTHDCIQESHCITRKAGKALLQIKGEKNNKELLQKKWTDQLTQWKNRLTCSRCTGILDFYLQRVADPDNKAIPHPAKLKRGNGALASMDNNNEHHCITTHKALLSITANFATLFKNKTCKEKRTIIEKSIARVTQWLSKMPDTCQCKQLVQNKIDNLNERLKQESSYLNDTASKTTSEYEESESDESESGTTYQRIKIRASTHIAATVTQFSPTQVNRMLTCEKIRTMRSNTGSYYSKRRPIDKPLITHKGLTWLVVLIESYHHIANHRDCTCKKLLKDAVELMKKNGASFTKPSATNFSNTLCTPKELIEKYVPELREFLLSLAPATSAPKRVKVMAPEHGTAVATNTEASLPVSSTCAQIQTITQNTSAFVANNSTNTNTLDAPVKTDNLNMTWLVMLIESYHYIANHRECTCKELLKKAIRLMLNNGASLNTVSQTHLSDTPCTPQELIEKHVPELREFIPTHTTTSTTASSAASAAAATSECPLLHTIAQHDITLIAALDSWYTAKEHPAECACKQRLRAIIQEKLAAGESRTKLRASITQQSMVSVNYFVQHILKDRTLLSLLNQMPITSAAGAAGSLY